MRNAGSTRAGKRREVEGLTVDAPTILAACSTSYSQTRGPETRMLCHRWRGGLECARHIAGSPIVLRSSGYRHRKLPSQRRPLPLPLDGRLGPWMADMSRLLKFKVPPANFPTEGPPTPRSRRPAAAFFGAGFSRTIPFSFASLRRFSSLYSALALIPLR